jgi:GT2 family glycosyltransferase
LPGAGFNQYTVFVEAEDLRAAEAHIERLEEELLRLKDVKRELQILREQHRRLQHTAEGRVARLLAKPWRWFMRSSKSGLRQPTEYECWLEQRRVSPEQVQSLREQAREFFYRPVISVLTPTFNPDATLISAAVNSLVAQSYENWELILVDDGSDKTNVALLEFAARDPRIQVMMEPQHRGISAALNTALKYARGEWIGLLDHDDLLEPDALFRVAELLQEDQGVDLIYSDEDKIIDGRFAAPMLKPDWSPEFFSAYDYLGHFVVMRREFASLGFRSEFDGAQDYDLLLRASERTQRIRHIPRVLYHWRRTTQSTAHNIRRKPGALEAGRRALEEHLTRRGEVGRVTIDWKTHAYRVRREVGSTAVTIVIVGGTEADVERIRVQTEFPRLEIVLASGNRPPNNVAGDWLLFIDHNLEPVDANWLTVMAEQLQNRQVGVVGARILAADGTVESAGLILCSNGLVRGAFAGFSRDDPGVNRQLQVVRNYSAVTASCLLTRRDIFDQTGGFDQKQSWPICAGADYCLRLRDAGFRIVSVPYAEVRRISRTESASASCSALAEKWPEMFKRDPCYNPNLSRERADFSLAR